MEKKTQIQNNHLKAVINHKGAELSELAKDGKNYIWTIDPKFWNKTSPVLFPIVGGLKEDKFEFEGREYQLPRHGFAREQEFELISKTEESAVFSLKFNAESLKIYPFQFELQIEYKLKDNALFVSYHVKNHGEKTMYFSVGAHPAFAVEGKFSEYSLEFDNNKPLTTYKLGDGVFSGKTEKVELTGRELPLDYGIFAKDALVLKNSATENLTLKKDGKPVLSVHFPKFPYLGIWTVADAPYICIEPWLGIADNFDTSGRLEEKEGINSLDSRQSFSASWSVVVY